MTLAPPDGVRTAPRRPRLDAIDALRGVAILGMMVFHVTWDLSFFGFLAPDAPRAPWLMNFGHAVAATFLALVGASLALAARDGFRPRPYLWRLASIVAAAAAITIGTALLFPESYIFFGILHCIAASSVGGAVVLARADLSDAARRLGRLRGASAHRGACARRRMAMDRGSARRRPTPMIGGPSCPWFGFALVGLAAMRARL